MWSDGMPEWSRLEDCQELILVLEHAAEAAEESANAEEPAVELVTNEAVSAHEPGSLDEYQAVCSRGARGAHGCADVRRTGPEQ